MRMQTLLLSAAVLAAAGFVAGGAQAAESNISDYGVAATPPALQTAQTAGTFVLEPVPGTNDLRRVYNFAALDTNGDGLLERFEVPHDMRYLRAYFGEADWNGDDKLSMREVAFYLHHTAPLYAGVGHSMVAVVRYHR